MTTTHAGNRRRYRGECPRCSHDVDAHILIAVIERPVAMGFAFCPEPECRCGGTWRATASESTPEEKAETHTRVVQALLDAGAPLPPFLLHGIQPP